MHLVCMYMYMCVCVCALCVCVCVYDGLLIDQRQAQKLMFTYHKLRHVHGTCIGDSGECSNATACVVNCIVVIFVCVCVCVL